MASSTLTSLIQPHADAFLLAVASSTDNFMLGISAGLSLASSSSSSAGENPQLLDFYKVNFVVAICNAGGTLLATYGGGGLAQLPEKALQKLAAAVTSSSSPERYLINVKAESILAATAFGYLAWKEYSELGGNKVIKAERISGDDKTNMARRSSGLSYSIALPLTLNNLAGGVAGGVLGVSVWQATFYAFLVSFGSMALGQFLAGRLVSVQRHTTRTSRNKTTDQSTLWCQYVAILIYLLLGLQSLLDV